MGIYLLTNWVKWFTCHSPIFRVLLADWLVKHSDVYFDFQFYLQDTKSSNGTFVNSQRLSKGSEESAPRQLYSGDIIQFGVDVMENSRRG